MKKQLKYGAVILLTTLMVACATKSGKTPTVDDKTGAQQDPSAQTSGAAGQKSAQEMEMEAKRRQQEMERQKLLSENVIYFPFDSASVDEQSRSVIQAHASYIAENPDVAVELQGHCDERGTREYNLALGERRSQSVQKLMQALGVSNNRAKSISYGEEKPVDPKHDESAWRKNRRVEIVYKAKS